MSGIAVLALCFLVQSFSQEKEEMVRSQRALELQADIFSQKSGEIFKDFYFDVQRLSASSIFLTESKEQVSNLLNQFVLNNKKYDAALFVDGLGRFQAANGISFEGRPLQIKNLEGRTYSDSVWFQKAIKGEFSESPAQGLTGSFVEDVNIDSISSALYGTTQHGLGFSRAVYGLNGSILGVLTLRASMRPFTDELSRQLQTLQAQNYLTSHLYLINSSGLVLSEAASPERFARITAGSNADRILRWNVSTQQGQQAASDSVRGRSGFIFEADRLDKNTRAWSFQPIKNNGFLEDLKWSVIVSAEASDMASDILAQRLWLGAAFIVTALSIGLITYGFSRTLSKQIADTLLRVKEEGRSLSDFCENFSGELRRAGSDSVERNLFIRSAAAEVDSLSVLKDESLGFVSQSREHVRSLADRSTQSEQAVQRVSIEIALAQRANEKISQLESSLAEASRKVAQLNEIVFKAKLISYNANIESSKAGIHGRGFVLVAQELESLVDGTDVILKEILTELSEGKTVLAEGAVAIRRSLSDSTLLIEDIVSKMADAKREFDALAEGLDVAHTAMETKIPSVTGVRDTLRAVEESLIHSQALMTDFGKVIHSINETGVRIDDLSQALSVSIKGGRVRQRSRRVGQPSGSGATLSGRASELDSELVRSDVVDRLAQKMRPRLVVEAEAEELDVSTEPRDSKDLRAG
jgi:methyl-accepting chemotaxis protein